MLTTLLVGCADKAEILCENRVAMSHQAGYDKAVSDIQLENLRNLRGDQLACQVYENLPIQLQNLAGLDCSQKWPEDIENISPSMSLMPALTLVFVIFLMFGFWYFVVPGLGDFVGQAQAAMSLKISPIRKQILVKVNEEEAALRAQLQPLRIQIRALQDDAKVAAEKATAAKEGEALARESLDELLEEIEGLREDLKHRISLSKKAESTADLTNLLGQIGKKPSK